MMEEFEPKKVDAESHFNIYVTCPHCNSWQDRRSDLCEHLDSNSLSADDIDVDLKCEDCGNVFTVENINY